MGKVIASASMSLDGYIAKDDNTIGRLFDWYENGAVDFPTATPDLTFHLSPTSAEYWRRWVDGLGALVCGRTLFDVTDGWGGRHTMDVPVVVVTHEIPAAWVEAHPDGAVPLRHRGRRGGRRRRRRRSPETAIVARRPPARSPGSVWSSAFWTRCPSTSCRW